MIRLYTTFYEETDSKRQNELFSALDKNLKNKLIDEIIVLSEGSPKLPINPKLKIISIINRPKFNNFINYINRSTNKEDINIIANTDIFFKNTIGVLNKVDLNNKCFAISRWDILPNGKSILFNHNDSQDAWIFKGRIKNLDANYPLGVPRCDNRFMYDLEQSGYTVFNPAFSIKAYHLHDRIEEIIYSDHDNKFNIKPPFKYKYPHNLYGYFKTLWFNLTNCNQIGRYRYDIKKINFWWPIRVIRKTIEISTNKKCKLFGFN